MRFRLQHIEDLLKVAMEEDHLRNGTANDNMPQGTDEEGRPNDASLLTNSQCRRTDSHDVFFDEGLFKASCAKLEEYLADNEDLEDSLKERYRVVRKEECVEVSGWPSDRTSQVSLCTI